MYINTDACVARINGIERSTPVPSILEKKTKRKTPPATSIISKPDKLPQLHPSSLNFFLALVLSLSQLYDHTSFLSE